MRIDRSKIIWYSKKADLTFTESYSLRNEWDKWCFDNLERESYQRPMLVFGYLDIGFYNEEDYALFLLTFG